MIHLSSGVRLDGDDERVFTAVDDEQAAGDGLYVADIVASTGLAEDRVREVVASLVDRAVLEASDADDRLGPRYVKGRAV